MRTSKKAFEMISLMVTTGEDAYPLLSLLDSVPQSDEEHNHEVHVS